MSVEDAKRGIVKNWEQYFPAASGQTVKTNGEINRPETWDDSAKMRAVLAEQDA
jgi:hypothetical protein